MVEVDETKLAQQNDGTPTAITTQGYKTSDEKMVPLSPGLPHGDHTGEDFSTDEASSRAADDALSVTSTSSRSFFRSPLMRKRQTDRSTADKERTRRTSEARREDDVSSSLGAELTVEIQKQGKDGGTWGIGDEARMNLE